MKDRKHSQLKVGSPTHYNNQKQAEKAPEKIQIQTVEGILEYVHPAIYERLKEENARLRYALGRILHEEYQPVARYPNYIQNIKKFAFEALQQEGGDQ